MPSNFVWVVICRFSAILPKWILPLKPFFLVFLLRKENATDKKNLGQWNPYLTWWLNTFCNHTRQIIQENRRKQHIRNVDNQNMNRLKSQVLNVGTFVDLWIEEGNDSNVFISTIGQFWAPFKKLFIFITQKMLVFQKSIQPFGSFKLTIMAEKIE